MTRGRRIVLGVVFAILSMVCGFVAGAYMGGRFFVPPGSGLAGGAIVFGYGLLGAGLGCLLGGLLAWLLPPRGFRAGLLLAAILSAILTAVLVARYLEVEQRQAESAVIQPRLG